MNINELIKTVNAKLIITKHPLHTEYFTCEINEAEIEEKERLMSVWGQGSTPEKAIQDYCTKIAGRTLVVNAFTKNRKEFKVPNNLRAV
jgi:hypothetical protein